MKFCSTTKCSGTVRFKQCYRLRSHFQSAEITVREGSREASENCGSVESGIAAGQATVRMQLKFNQVQKDHPLITLQVNSSKKNKYYELFNFDQNENGYETIDSLKDYIDDVHLFPILFQVNNEINKQITFKVEPFFGQSNVKKHEEDINAIFQRVTYMAKTAVNLFNGFQGNNELYNSNLLEHAKNYIDEETVKEYNSKSFIAICVYYHTQDNIALLIEFVDYFKSKHIRRTKSDGDSKWVSEDPKIQYLCGNELINYLKITLFCLTNKIVVRLDKQVSYTDNQIVNNVTSESSEIKNPKNMDVTKSYNKDLEAVESYTCYVHNLKQYYDTNIRNLVDQLKLLCTFKFDIYLEIIFCISNCVISIYDSGGSKKDYLFYKPGPGPPEDNVYVYFYEKSEQEGRPDTVPLMLKFKGKYYGFNERILYFTSWREINHIKPTHGTSDASNVVKTKLDELNKSLNKIILVKNTNYGLLDLSCSLKTKEFNFDTNRICVNKYAVPDFREFDPIRSDNIHCEYSVYSKYIHRTVNTFRLGDIEYPVTKKPERNGAPLTNGKVIDVKDDQNQLTVYYLTSDTTHTYPLLIGIGKKYTVDDFYKLISKNSDYVWKKLEEKEKSPLKGGTVNTEIIKLLDGINYCLKKIVKIKLEKRISYDLEGRPITPDSGNRFEKIQNYQELTKENNSSNVSSQKIKSDLVDYGPIYYTSCKPKLYVYFYRDDPRPGLLCFELKFLTDVLDGLYFSSQFEKFISEYWVTLSAGAGGGVIGVGGVAGGGLNLLL
nr:hypothetical protein MACL_00000469 [Theileria orientalis]